MIFDPLTPKQKQVLDYVQDFVLQNGYAPSISEICSGLGLSSTSTVHKHLQILGRKGYLDVMPRKSRWLQVKSNVVSGAVEVPLIGMVAAGFPIEFCEVPSTIALPESMLGRNETFVLQVKGQSMIDEAITDGDYVIVEKRDSALNGEMVIACIDNEDITLKRFFHEADQIRLQPSNSSMTPIIIKDRQVTIKGVVIGVMRKYKRF
ncbi:MAG: transcriptional repressor LexA [Candidatus Riflebacteria bacterium]|nr:transcriptional repressor LexA [Candidatus Riflebacteria bacterium]